MFFAVYFFTFCDYFERKIVYNACIINRQIQRIHYPRTRKGTMNAIGTDYAIIEHCNNAIYCIMRECKIDAMQMPKSFKDRKSILLSAMNEHKTLAISLFGVKYWKTFSEEFSKMENLIKLHAIELLGPLNAEQKLELQNFNGKMKARMLSAHGITDDNYGKLIQAMTENPTHVSKELYPEWMHACSDLPIVSFIVMNKARNFVAHPTALENILAYDPKLKARYNELCDCKIDNNRKVSDVSESSYTSSEHNVSNASESSFSGYASATSNASDSSYVSPSHATHEENAKKNFHTEMDAHVAKLMMMEEAHNAEFKAIMRPTPKMNEQLAELVMISDGHLNAYKESQQYWVDMRAMLKARNAY